MPLDRWALEPSRWSHRVARLAKASNRATRRWAVIGIVIGLISGALFYRLSHGPPCSPAPTHDASLVTAKLSADPDTVINVDTYGLRGWPVKGDHVAGCAQCRSSRLENWLRKHADMALGTQRFNLKVSNATTNELHIYEFKFAARVLNTTQQQFIRMERGGAGPENTVRLGLDLKPGVGRAKKYLVDKETQESYPVDTLDYVVQPCDTARFITDVSAVAPVVWSLRLETSSIGGPAETSLKVEIPKPYTRLGPDDLSAPMRRWLHPLSESSPQLMTDDGTR